MTATTTPSVQSPPTFDRIGQYAWAFGVTYALDAALELKLFTRISKGATTVAKLAAESGASPRAVRQLVDLMVGLGLIVRSGSGDGAQHSLAPDADFFLVEGKPSYVGGFVQFHAHPISDHWGQLRDIVRTGKPAKAVDRPEEGAPFWPDLVDALFGMNFGAAQLLGRELAKLHGNGPIRLLDVAAGSGVWGIGAAVAEPRVRTTALDLADTLPNTRKHVAKFQLEKRFEFLPGNLREVDFGEKRFEAIMLGHICHSEGAEHTQTLLAKCARALVSGGTLAIAEFVPNDDRAAPVGPLIFALNMLVNTTDGDTFTVAQFRAWLTKLGFRDVRTLQAPAPSPLILATR